MEKRDMVKDFMKVKEELDMVNEKIIKLKATSEDSLKRLEEILIKNGVKTIDELKKKKEDVEKEMYLLMGAIDAYLKASKERLNTIDGIGV